MDLKVSGFQIGWLRQWSGLLKGLVEECFGSKMFQKCVPKHRVPAVLREGAGAERGVRRGSPSFAVGGLGRGRAGEQGHPRLGGVCVLRRPSGGGGSAHVWVWLAGLCLCPQKPVPALSPPPALRGFLLMGPQLFVRGLVRPDLSPHAWLLGPVHRRPTQGRRLTGD